MWKRLQLGMPAQGGTNGSRAVRIVDVLPLGLGSKLAVVEFQGRELLVSVSKTDVRLIADSHD
jgi:flagellar protein FliO/FliZ